MALRLFSFPGIERLAEGISRGLGAKLEPWTLRRFPDGETYLRADVSLAADDAIVLANLRDPDEKLAPLLFLAATLRALGAKRVLLIAPYLAYMRQDIRFNPGEGLTSRYFARLLSGYFDGLVTVDPHLHRYHSLDEIYSIPSRLCHAAPELAEWIRDNVTAPLLIGPDAESLQWVREVGAACEAPFLTAEKRRLGDREVEIEISGLDRFPGRQIVVIDDIISSAATMRGIVAKIRAAGFAEVRCLGVHGLFAGDAYRELLAAGADQVVTTNTIPHVSNQIDLSALLATRTRDLLADLEARQ